MIDARSLVPFDYTEVLASVAKTGRLICVSDANLRGSWLNTVAAKVSTESFDDLDGPVVVLGARNWIAPPAEMEWEFFVTPEDILDAIHTRVLPLPATGSKKDLARRAHSRSRDWVSDQARLCYSTELLGYSPEARVLIINADDFGMYPSVNNAVMQSIENGIARSAA